MAVLRYNISPQLGEGLWEKASQYIVGDLATRFF